MKRVLFLMGAWMLWSGSAAAYVPISYTATDCLGTTRTLTAHLYPPTDTSIQYPAVIANRARGGGSTDSVDPLNDLLALDGYVVIASEYYESEYCISEVLPLIDFLKTLPYVDPANIFMFGTSWGGKETLEAAMSSTEIRAAVAIAPAMVVALAQQSGVTIADLEAELETLYGPGKSMQWDSVAAPILLIHGSADPTVPQIVQQAIAGVLANHGKVYSAITYPGIGHTPILENTARVHADTLAWFEQYRNGGSPDTVPPVITLDTPSSGDVVSGTVQVTGTVSDNVGVRSVEILVDGTVIGVATLGSSWSYDLDTTTLSPGVHQLEARASDTSLNQTTTNAVTITVLGDPGTGGTPAGSAGASGSSGGMGCGSIQAGSFQTKDRRMDHVLNMTLLAFLPFLLRRFRHIAPGKITPSH